MGSRWARFPSTEQPTTKTIYQEALTTRERTLDKSRSGAGIYTQTSETWPVLGGVSWFGKGGARVGRSGMVAE